MDWWPDLGPAVRPRTVGPLQTGGPKRTNLERGMPHMAVKEVHLL